MIDRILNKEAFYKIKSYLNGIVMWREHQGNIIVRQISPHKEVFDLLLGFKVFELNEKR